MKNLNIGARLGLGFAVVIVLLLVMTFTSLTRMGEAGALTSRLVNTSMKNQATVAEWRTLTEVNNAIMDTIYHGADAGIVAEYEPRLRANIQRGNELQADVDANLLNAKVRVYLDRAKALRADFSQAREDVLKARLANDPAAIEQAYKRRFEPASKAFVDALDEFAKQQSTATAGVGTRILDSFAETRVILIALGIVAVVFGIACAIFITRTITAPLGRALEVAERVAAGDLTSRFESNRRDEVGQLMDALGRMNASLAAIVGQVRDGTATIARASDEIASGNQDLSSRTEQQASSLEETAASMEELTATVRQNSEHARRANGLAGSAASIAREGGRMVGDVVGTMGKIDASSQRIVDIIGVIDGIAFQTNILALNAAVEAARAGEQGRGFAVVASEVRNLAQRSATAAKEIKTLIDDSVEQVQEGTRQVGRAGATMQQIVDSIGQVTTIVSEIAAASEEQSAGIDGVNTAVVEMDRVTQQNAALVEQAAAAAESLREQAAQLADVVGTFRLAAGQESPVAAAAPQRTTAPRPLLSAQPA
ncbi:methyl-accepting chemotaxis protein [Massilia sp.]|uniref:methyl-accepting chemotaxis protein n=1 Tax=Massilia sp. TaxID=1882437 RepID=UPI0028A21D89|nr:methyl-accepting chemotaxis protein [Massilia sp.]